jgi:2-keto-4-pentenoate hydratase/2-oxohepta-3-ene-1,7-dioic acid hydratase in catechol pathway
MKLYLGLTESSAPQQTRILGELEGHLIDLNFAYAAYLTEQRRYSGAYELAAFCFPATIEAFIERGAQARRALDEVLTFLSRKPGDLSGPGGERIFYAKNDIRLLPPFQHPEKSLVIGFSDKARATAPPAAEIPTGFYKLPQTFISTGAPIVWPKFSSELDADACMAIVIGKAAKSIAPEQAWSHVAGVTLMIDITARDVNRREGLTTNNLLGKNFPSSTSIGPAFLCANSRKELESLEIELSLDGSPRQRFTLGQCVFTVEQIIARWSLVGLKPGDLLAIGASMAFHGERLGSPVPLKVGAAISCASPAIGELSHRVVAAGGLRL